MTTATQARAAFAPISLSRVRSGSEAAIFVVAATRVLWFPMLPNRGDHGWGSFAIAHTPTTIYGSSHLAQFALYCLSRLRLGPVAPSHALAALHLGSRVVGLVYLLAVWSWGRKLEPGLGRLLFLLVGMLLTPVTVYFTGYEEIGFYSLPFALLGMSIASGKGRFGSSRYFGAATAGIGAALHGLGFFFLPAFFSLPRGRSRAAWFEMLAENVRTVLAFFAPNGIALLVYLLRLKNVSIVPGDAHGGENGSLLLSWTYRRDGHYFLQGVHVVHVLEIVALTAPALFIAALAFARGPAPRLEPFRTKPWLVSLSLLGAFGLVFGARFNANPWFGAVYDFDMYAAALAPLQLAATAYVCTKNGGLVAKAAVVIVSLVVTAVFHRWIQTTTLGIPGFLDGIQLIWFPVTRPMA